MIRSGLIGLAVLAAVSGARAAPVPVSGAGHAQDCFAAAEQRRPLKPALRSCDKALAKDNLGNDDRAATLLNRGFVRLQWGGAAEAIRDFDAAIALQPAIAEAYVNKGIALMRLGNRDAEALATLSEAIARNPQHPEIAYYHRAVAYEALGRAREAYEDYSRAAALAPEWADPAEQLQRFKTVRAKTMSG